MRRLLWMSALAIVVGSLPAMADIWSPHYSSGTGWPSAQQEGLHVPEAGTVPLLLTMLGGAAGLAKLLGKRLG